ncbi:hypothetical protein AAVH_41539, partial [Aphelenchoides avenae]
MADRKEGKHSSFFMLSLACSRHAMDILEEEIIDVQRDDGTSLAYQVDRHRIVGESRPLLFHSNDCKGSMLIGNHPAG